MKKIDEVELKSIQTSINNPGPHNIITPESINGWPVISMPDRSTITHNYYFSYNNELVAEFIHESNTLTIIENCYYEETPSTSPFDIAINEGVGVRQIHGGVRNLKTLIARAIDNIPTVTIPSQIEDGQNYEVINQDGNWTGYIDFANKVMFFYSICIVEEHSACLGFQMMYYGI